MDERTGMTSEDDMAILPGNTDWREKAKLKRRMPSPEGERKSSNKGKRK